MIEKGLHPGDELLLLCFRGLWLLLRRHLASFDLLNHVLPGFDILTEVVKVREPFEIKAAFLVCSGMAGQAVLLQDRLNIAGESVSQLLCRFLGCCGAGRSHDDSECNPGAYQSHTVAELEERVCRQVQNSRGGNNRQDCTLLHRV